MRQPIRLPLLACSAALLLAVAACSGSTDPKTQEPANLAPGLYEISVSHSTKQFKGQKEAPKSICVRTSDADAFPFKLPEQYYMISGGCRPVRAPREGNNISGEIICAADSKAAGGSTRFVYSGVIAEEGVVVEAGMRIDVDLPKGTRDDGKSEAEWDKAKKLFEDVKTVIEARRLSDCP